MTGTSAMRRRSCISSMPSVAGAASGPAAPGGAAPPASGAVASSGIPGHHRQITRPGQCVPHVAQGLGIVVHRQHPHLLIQFLSGGCGAMRIEQAPPGCSWTAAPLGRVKVKRAPVPGPPLSARMRPPWASTIPLQMARPSPVSSPPSSSDWTRENLRNRRGRPSAGMPRPSSDTETAT